MITSFSQSFASDVLAKWSESILSLSAAADRQQRELIDGSIGWVATLSDPGKCMGRLSRLNQEMGSALAQSVADWLRLMSADQACFAEQLQKGEELTHSKTILEAQSTLAALVESTQRLLRVRAHTALRSGARLMQPFSMSETAL